MISLGQFNLQGDSITTDSERLKVSNYNFDLQPECPTQQIINRDIRPSQFHPHNASIAMYCSNSLLILLVARFQKFPKRKLFTRLSSLFIATCPAYPTLLNVISLLSRDLFTKQHVPISSLILKHTHTHTHEQIHKHQAYRPTQPIRILYAIHSKIEYLQPLSLTDDVNRQTAPVFCILLTVHLLMILCK